jgi:hypothetical protein
MEFSIEDSPPGFTRFAVVNNDTNHEEPVFLTTIVPQTYQPNEVSKQKKKTSNIKVHQIIAKKKKQHSSAIRFLQM